MFSKPFLTFEIQTPLCYPCAMAQRFQRFRSEAGMFFSYFIVSLLILFPLVPHLFSKLAFASNGDVRLSLTILFSNLSKIARCDLLNIFQLPILFPLSHTLTAGINLFGQSLLVLPLFLIHVRNVYFIYNLLTFFAYSAAGYCAYRFVREWVSERWIAWLIGALYILMPFRVHNIPQLNLLFSFPIPLTLLFFSRFLKNNRTGDLFFFFLSLLSQFLFDLSVGIFLGITIGIFFLFWQIIYGFLPKRSWMPLAAGTILFLLAVALLFMPYLSQKTSFSIIGEIKSIPTFAFHSPLSFYSNWSYLLLFFNRIVWHQSPYSPGITIFFFFMLAFAPYLENRLQRITALFCLSSLIIPAIVMPFIFKSVQFGMLNRVLGWTLLLFILGLGLLLFLIRKKIPPPLLLLTTTWIFLQFYSSQVSLPFFNVFQGLAQLFSFLLRARFIRTEYILALLFFTVSAFGFSYFFKRFHEKKTLLALVLLLVVAERIRWPVVPERLEDDRPEIRKLYQLVDHYPDHFGLLELPFDQKEPNYYTLFALYHDKHTYHGHINYLKDTCQLNDNPQIRTGSKLPGLGDPQFIRELKMSGIRLILLFKSRLLDEDQQTWGLIQNHIRSGESKGLYEKVKKNNYGTLLVLNEREKGPQIRYFLPHYALRGKSNLICSINANEETQAEFLFNGSPVKKEFFQKETRNRIMITLKNRSLAPQFNYLEIRSGPSLELVKVRIE